MNRPTITALAVVLVVIVLAAILLVNRSASNTSTPSPSPSVETSPESSASPQAQASPSGSPAADQSSATVDVTSNGFSPASMTIKSGSSITFKNSTAEEVQPSSDPHPQHTINPELNIGLIQPGSSKTVTLSRKGTWGIHDHMNDSWTGTVIVQ